MRLTCPNCGAQYEVDDNVIPTGGRDVQCSNCGHTWYQRAASREAEAQQEQVHAPEPEMAEAEMAEAAPEPAPQPSRVAPEVADILQEEAELERSERASEAGSLETQPDLGIDSADETPPNVSERMARLRGMGDELEPTAMAAAAAPATRKELLPDIEEINSSLTPDGDDDDEGSASAQENARRGGFRRGFAFAILIFALMLVVYMYAPRIVALNPATEPALSAYVDWVNGLRVGMDNFMSNAATRISALVAQIGGDS